MSQNETPEIPDGLREILDDEEIENMQNLDGWAYGTVAEVDDGSAVRTSKAWIETFDGDGGAGEFKGVRIHAVEWLEEVSFAPEEVPLEAYAYANRERFEESGNDVGFYVTEYTHGEEVDE